MASRITVRISSDALEARVVVAEGAPMAPEALLQALENADVVRGIDHDLVEQMARHLVDGAFKEDKVLATGTAPVHGEDSRLETLFEIGLVPGEAQEDGRIDFRERGLLLPVEKGQLLARIHVATRGEAGVGVDGRPIPARPGKATSITFGDGVRKKGQELLAKRDGVVTQQKGGRIDVVDLIEHQGDVGLESGNLEMKGSIVVNGTVGPAFEVRATGDAIIHGDVDGGIVGAGGSVVIARSAFGGHTEGRVRAGRDLCLRAARSINLRAAKTIEIERESIDSKLSCRQVVADGGRTKLRGGEIRAAEQVVADEIGAASGVETLVVVAVAAEAEEALAKIERAEANRRRSARKRGGGDRAGKSGKAARAGLGADEEAIQARLALRRERRELLARAFIEVNGTIHPGVTLVFGDRELKIQETLRAVRFRWDAENRTIVHEDLKS